MFRRVAESFPSLLSVSILAAFLSFAGRASGQGNPGTPSFSAFDSHEADTINLQNLNIMVNVPVFQKSGAFPLGFVLQANSYVFQQTLAGGNLYWKPGLSTNLSGSVGGLLGLSLPFSNKTATSNVLCPDGHTRTTTYTNWYVSFADGTKHALPVTDETDSANCFNTSGTFTDQTIDGSGYTVTVSGINISSVYDSFGKSLATSAVTDSNSNSISVAVTSGVSGVFTDTLGVNPALTYGVQSGSTVQNGTYWWKDINAGSPQVTETNTGVELKSNFGCAPGVVDYDLTGQSLTTNISFPDSTTFGIQYESTPGGTSGQYTGRISQLTLRRGGTIGYQYTGIDCTWQSPLTLKRTTSDGTTTYAWAAVFNGGGSYGNTTTVTDQGGNQTVYTFSGLNATSPAGPILTQVQRYQGTSTLLSTTLICYNNNFTNCSTAVVALPVTKRDVYTYPAGMTLGNARLTEQTYDKYGNVLTDLEFDFNQTLVSTTTTTYGTWNGSSCVSIGNNINNKPCQVVTVMGSNTVAQSRFAYDSHGNLLTKYAWNGSSWLSNTTANTYNTNGTVAASYDLANNKTTYAYNGTGGCNNLFPTSITAGGLTAYNTWNCTGGVKLTSKDASGNTTSYGYVNTLGVAEPFWRLSSVTDPLGNKTWTTYTATSVNSTMNFGSSINNTTVTTDGYSRPINSQTQQAPSSSTYDTISSTYGWSTTNPNYFSQFTSLPCATTSGASCSGTGVTTLVDPLGRPYTTTDGGGGTVTKTYPQNDVLTVLSPVPVPENNKMTQKEYDGLGRLVKLCQILSTGGTLCGQNTGTYSGNLTSYVYSSIAGGTQVQVTRASQTRTKKYDALGRLTYDSEPESGVKNFFYDAGSSSPACAASVGDLGYSTDANSNTVCHTYDALHRATSTLSSGGSTPDLYYVYDSATVDSVVMSNTAGRLAEQYTVAHGGGSGGTKITDEGLSYDANGRMSDLYQKTPHSGGWYHTTVGLAANGAVTTLTGIPGYATETYTLDGEGRPQTAAEGSTTIVSGATFNAASQPLTIAIGAAGGDSDSYAYWPNTGRMKTYTFTVGATPKSMVGTLTWNTDGMLGTLAITDGFNAGGAQTCNFGTSTVAGYDDLGRLVDNDCSPTWAQTFSYDQYNNVTKSGSVVWNPGYNAANNHYTLAGTTYDNNGNLTNDSFNTYAWNAYNQMASIGVSPVCGTSGTCVTYDASGRMVEKSVGSVYTEYLYSPVGMIASMNGGTTIDARIPLPGGASLYKTANTTRYIEHKDWLGSARLLSTLANRTVSYDRAFAPYGEMYDNFGTNTQLNFTGDRQDTIAGIFDTPTRKLYPNQGRWLSPDPAEAGWNLYAYPANPNSSVDPSGLVGGSGLGDDPQRLIPPWQYLANMNLNLNVVAFDSTTPVATVTTAAINSIGGQVVGIIYPNGSQWAYEGPLTPAVGPILAQTVEGLEDIESGHGYFLRALVGGGLISSGLFVGAVGIAAIPAGCAFGGPAGCIVGVVAGLPVAAAGILSVGEGLSFLVDGTFFDPRFWITPGSQTSPRFP